MVIGVNNTNTPPALSDADFLTSAAAKLGIDGGEVKASFTDKSENFSLQGEVKDKFDFEGNNEAKASLTASTSVGDNSTLFASVTGESKNGDSSKTYAAGVKYSSSDEAAGTSRTGQLTVSSKDGQESVQVKGGLKDALTDSATLTANIQFDRAGGETDVKQSAQLDLSFDDSVIDSATFGEFIDTKKGSGLTASVDKSFSDELSGSAGFGAFDDGSQIVSAGVDYALSDDTSLYANVSSYDQDASDTANGAKLGVKTNIAENLNLNVGGFVGDYTEFKDTAAPKSQDEGVFANFEYNF